MELNTNKTSTEKEVGWLEYRLPIRSFIRKFMGSGYKTPKNLSFLWNFGVLLGICLMVQIATGIVLACHYVPHADHAFQSVEHIMRDVRMGWLLRYAHANGASFFFMALYIHIGRGIYYGSHKSPREMVWIVGVVIYFALMAAAFLGYVLPWGQMSFWGATVITNLVGTIPFVGEPLLKFLWGGFSINSPTLNRAFVMHYLVPIIIAALVIIHLWALHRFGSNNPTGKEVKSDQDTIPFHPYYTTKDAITVGIYVICFSVFIFFIPNYLGHPDNYIPANPMVTPAHIVPEWYFLPFYCILRSIPSKSLGALAFLLSIAVLFVLPWLDTSKVKSGRYRPIFKKIFVLFTVNFFALMWLGSKPPEGWYIYAGRLATLVHFGFFLALPLLGKYEKTLPEPKTISEDFTNRKKKSV